jgi:hypothetical protein
MAANPATLTDLQDRALRTLSDTETTAAPVWLGDAYNKLVTQLPSVDTRLDAATSTVFEELVVATVCAMVMRVFNNPNGLLEEGVDDYTSRRDSTTSSGVLYATDEELALLAESGSSANAFTISPVGRTPDPTWTPDRVMFW